MIKKTKDEELSFNVWTCCGTQFEHKEMVEHLQSVHGIQPPINAKRKMTKHLDARDWFQSEYEWTLGELVLHQSIRTERAEDDMMRFA